MEGERELPATRNVWTVNAANTLITYTGDTLRGDNYLCKSLGDIIHSTRR